MTNVAVYSAVYGDYDTPRVQPPLDAPAYLYTDNPNLRWDGWETRCYGLSAIPTSMLRAKWWKTHPAEAAPNADISMYIDGSMTITTEDYVAKCLTALGDDDFVLVTHPWRSCIYTEATYSATLPRYAYANLRAQVDFYRQNLGHPADWGLFASGANVRRHTDAVITWSHHWWYENATRTWQDQVSLPVMVRLAGDAIKWNTNMPWAEWWSLAGHTR